MTYALPKTRTNYGVFYVRYQGGKTWNAISYYYAVSFYHLNNLRKSSNQALLQAIN